MELDYNKLLLLAGELGYRLMESGAEIYRVEESVHRLLRAYGVEEGEVFAIPNCIIISLTSPQGEPLTQIRRMPAHGTDIYLLEKYNGLCRALCRHAPPFDQALEQLERIGRERLAYPLWVELLAYFLGCGMFTLFYGGTLLYFHVGVAAGYGASLLWGTRSIWLCALPLLGTAALIGTSRRVPAAETAAAGAGR